MATKRIVSGTRATGDLHIGNYIGAIKQWIKMTEDRDSEFFFFVADLHAITTPFDAATLADNTREITAAYIACGLDADKVTLFPQSAVPQHAYLQWLLSSISSMGWLNRMTQFKEKAGKHRDNASLSLYAYPVLQAADVLLYQATHVPVGEDQKQHIELARDIANSFNHHYRPFFTEPEPIILGEGARIMSLRDGTNKMSKTAESDMSKINLTDDADLIAKKIRKAKTDMDPLGETVDSLKDRPEALNLVTIYAALADISRAEVLAQFSGKQFSEFKPALADLAVEKLAPITARMNELMADKAEIDKILKAGAEKAESVAAPVLEEAKRIMGFWR
ncbi:MAG: tryptophan--tRNA ligase [Rhodospirillales bacterium]|nr:tryptophan--tRNA ligase [Rhodospirillales bacterium]